MLLASGAPPAIQDLSNLQGQLNDTVGYLDSAVHALQELRASFITDPQGRLRVLLDNITASLTLATITTVGTVTTVTTVTTATDVTRLNNMGTSTFNNFAGIIPWNEMNIQANVLRQNIITT